MDAPEDAAAPQPTTTLRLAKRKLTAAGGALGLRPGDVLVAVNGKVFAGSARNLTERFLQNGGRPLALTFARGELELTVLADTSDLGHWEAEPARTDWSGERQDPETLRNWEILRAEDGRYDLHPLQPGMIALMCPPLWLLQNRLWVPAAAITAAIAVSAAIWWVLVPFVYVACGMILRRTGATLFRIDRVQMGMAPYATVAAYTEAGAHAAYGKIDPKGQFIYGKARPPIADEEVV